ncbi:MAG: hypothetical protein AB7U49_08010 [Hyphomicrobiaceae bacterium]
MNAVKTMVANGGIACLGLGLVLFVPAFASDPLFWVPAALLTQIWVCCIRRVGR